MTVYFTSDLHLGHRLVSELRGFDSPQEHDAALTEKWNAQVKPTDLVWILGDLTLKAPKVVVEQVLALNGRKRLILGNHDQGHPAFRDAHKAAIQDAYAAMFEWVSTAARVRIQGIDVLLSHFPYSADREEFETARFAQWRLPDLGVQLVHGHLHSEYVWDYKTPREFHVGLDATQLRPLSDHDLHELLVKAEPMGRAAREEYLSEEVEADQAARA